MRQPKILVFSGSTRSGSYNSKLAALVGKHLALGDAEVTQISLADYPLPLYDGDLEAGRGVPVHAQTLKTLFQKQDGVFIACPEYNAGVTPVLKNAIDWISRPTVPGEGEPTAFRHRLFALGAASTGRFGGMRGLMGMRTILEVGLGAAVLPQMVTVAESTTGFTAKGDLADDKASAQLESLVQALNRQTRLLLGP